MDKWDVFAIIVFVSVIILTTLSISKQYYMQKLSAKENEFTTAVRRAAYNKTHLCLDDGTFYDIKIYRMDGNREFYVVKPEK